MSRSSDSPAHPRAGQPHSATTAAPLDALREELRTLRLLRGQPSLRVIAQNTEWGHATVGRALRCESVPRWDVVEAIVLRLDGDVARVRALWVECMQAPRPTPEHASEAVGPNLPHDKFPALATGIAFCVFVSCIAAFSFFVPAGPDANKTATDIALSLLGGVASLSWFVVFFQRRDTRSLALGLGMAGWALWRTQELSAAAAESMPPSPSTRDCLFLLFPIFALPGIASAWSRHTQRKHISASAFLAAAAAAALVSFIAHSGTELPANRVFLSAWSISLDLAMLVLAVLSARQDPRWEFRIVMFSLGALLAADILFAALPALPPPNPIAFLAALCSLVFALLMLVAASSAKTGAASP